MILYRSKIFLFGIVMLCLCSCNNENSSLVEPRQKPTLEFLVSNSDSISIIEITDAPSKGPKTKFKTAQIATANMVKNIKGTNFDQVKIENTPYFKAKNAVFHITMLRSGTYFSFLKKEGNKDLYYQPLTGASLLSIFDGKVQPIWVALNDPYDEKGASLELVINEIKDLMNR